MAELVLLPEYRCRRCGVQHLDKSKPPETTPALLALAVLQMEAIIDKKQAERLDTKLAYRLHLLHPCGDTDGMGVSDFIGVKYIEDEASGG